MSKTDAFRRYMSDCGYDPPSRVVADGKIYRFYVKGDKPGSENGWYVLNQVGHGAFGSWRRGTKFTWSKKAQSDMTPLEKKSFDTKISIVMRQHEEERKRIHAECRKKAKAIWGKASKKGTSKHPYTKSKGIKPYSARINGMGSLIIPLYNIKNRLQGLQYIDSKGVKKFLTGTAKKKSFSLLGEKPEQASAIVLCEGWATGCSLHEATGLPVVVAYDAGNLKPVAEVLRQQLPDQKIIIAGDDDHATERNPGRTKATEAARSINGIAVFPEFENVDKKTDFNDMHQEQGIEAVRVVIMEACSKDPEDYDCDDEIWLEPLLFGDIETPNIPCSLLPKVLARFCRAVANNTQTPLGMAVMMALAAVSTCLQKLFKVSPYGDDYKESVNIYAVVGLDSGSRKTPVNTAMNAPLTIWEKDQAEALKEKAAQVRHEREMIIRTIDAIKTKASKPDTTDEERQDALTEVKRLEESMPDEIILPRLYVDDVTPERLQNLMVEHGERMAVISDEGGVFEVISGLYTGGQINVNVFLQSYSGSPVRVDRQGRTAIMNNPALTFGLTVQPDIISSLASGNKARFRGNGLLARFLYCMPRSTVGKRDVTKREPIPESIKNNYHALIFRLLSIRPKHDENGQERPRILTLAPDALKIWLDFSQDIESKQGQHGEYHPIKDWTSKLPGSALRIAGLCHVVEHGKKVTIINLMTMERAIKLAKLLIIHAQAAFGIMGGDLAVSDAKVVFHWIVCNGTPSFRRSDLHRALHGRFVRVERLKAALNVLTERHIISEPQKSHTGRRPGIFHTVNPAILNENGNGKK
jgi:putative DNA primase/helicase